jgi:hypothetical protein
MQGRNLSPRLTCEACLAADISIINLLLGKLQNGPARHAKLIKNANQAFKEKSALVDAASQTVEGTRDEVGDILVEVL